MFYHMREYGEKKYCELVHSIDWRFILIHMNSFDRFPRPKSRVNGGHSVYEYIAYAVGSIIVYSGRH